MIDPRKNLLTTKAQNVRRLLIQKSLCEKVGQSEEMHLEKLTELGCSNTTIREQLIVVNECTIDLISIKQSLLQELYELKFCIQDATLLNWTAEYKTACDAFSEGTMVF